MTADGYVAYGDTSAGTLSVLGVEQEDGGLPSSSSPSSLGAADIETAYVLGRLVLFFSPSTEADAGPSRVGTLNAWSSSLGSPQVVSSGALESLTYFTFAASADGQYVAYLGDVSSDGTSASLYVANVATGAKTELVSSIDVVADACQPRISFSGEYVAASYCHVAPLAGTDGGTNRFVATVATFLASSGQAATLATNVDSRFGVDPGGVAAIMLGAAGLVASPIAGSGAADAGPTTIDTAGTSAIISGDGKTVVYATKSDALKRANTFAPLDVLQLVPSSFAAVTALSGDGSWVLGMLRAGTVTDTGDLYAASATAPGSASTLSSATSASSSIAGDAFTADSHYAVFLTNVTSSFTGTLMASALGAGGAPATLGSGAYEELAALGSQIVFNLNDANGKADLEWADLSTKNPPTLVASQADETFFLGPARDRIVYTVSGAGSAADGLWIAPLPGTPGTVITCANAGTAAFHPAVGAAGDCTAAEISTFDTDCVAAGTTTTTCSGIQSAISATCYACLDTQLSDGAWGVLIENPAGGGIVQLNAGGCYARQGDALCATALEAQLECEDDACASQTDIDSFNTCQSNADTTTCACQVQNSSTACALVLSWPCDPGAYTVFETEFLAYAKVICQGAQP